jgi:hypothetical protein
LPVELDRRNQQIDVVGAFDVDFAMGDDLTHGLLNLDRLAKLGRFGGLAFANEFWCGARARSRSCQRGGCSLTMRPRLFAQSRTLGT